MSILTLDNFRHETRFVLRVSSRDVGKRIVSLAMILAICWSTGARWPVVGIAALVLACEASLMLALRFEPPPDEDVPLWLAVWMWLTNIPSTVFYLAPAAILAAQPQIPLVLAGFLWLFGIFVHVSNSFVALPLYNWSQMVPAFAAGLGVVAISAVNHDGLAAPGLWLVVAGLCVVYGANTIETMATQKELLRDLTAARTEAKARLAALEHLTRHDPLTGLLNRLAFDAGLARLLARRRAGREVAVMLFDLDGFKPINDTYSHAAGDLVLGVIAKRLGALAGEEGLAARLGGDEFALALPGIGSAAGALDLAARAQRAIEEPIAHGETLLRIGGSVGVALSDGRGPPAAVREAPPPLGPDGLAGPAGAAETAVSALCAGADQAMYAAKAAMRVGGGRRAVLYDPADFPPRPSLEDRRRLSEALAARRIGPVYEPVLDLETGDVAGFEARPRWEDTQGDLRGDSQGGAMPPERFLPLIGEFGLQGDFLRAMAEQVFADVEALVAEGLDPGRVALAVPEIALATYSGRQDLDRILAASPRGRLHVVLAISQDVFVARAASMIQDGIGHFRSLGLGISLDGFGTGPASFRHLGEIDFDEIKIDADLVAGLGLDPVADILVKGFASIGRGFGARLVAEGVATEEQRRHLLRLGCRFGQGTLMGAPMPLARVRDRLAGVAADLPPLRVAGG